MSSCSIVELVHSPLAHGEFVSSRATAGRIGAAKSCCAASSAESWWRASRSFSPCRHQSAPQHARPARSGWVKRRSAASASRAAFFTRPFWFSATGPPGTMEQAASPQPDGMRTGGCHQQLLLGTCGVAPLLSDPRVRTAC
jgi:hypothetical protein